jgi:hypothetical protein
VPYTAILCPVYTFMLDLVLLPVLLAYWDKNCYQFYCHTVLCTAASFTSKQSLVFNGILGPVHLPVFTTILGSRTTTSFYWHTRTSTAILGPELLPHPSSRQFLQKTLLLWIVTAKILCIVYFVQKTTVNKFMWGKLNEN